MMLPLINRKAIIGTHRDSGLVPETLSPNISAMTR